MELPDGLGEKEIRAYFAAVVGTFRGPYGTRSNQRYGTPGESFQLVSNSTRNKVLSVFVSRNDGAPQTLSVTFSGAPIAGTSDFAASFATNSIVRFILYPGDILSMTLNEVPVVPLKLVIGQEPY